MRSRASSFKWDYSLLSPSISHTWYLSFWKETIQEKWQCGSFSICFPHRSTTAVQTTLVTPVAIRIWTISSIICFVLQVTTEDAASGISFWCPSSSYRIQKYKNVSKSGRMQRRWNGERENKNVPLCIHVMHFVKITHKVQAYLKEKTVRFCLVFLSHIW
jgi:hypothetical protein